VHEDGDPDGVVPDNGAMTTLVPADSPPGDLAPPVVSGGVVVASVLLAGSVVPLLAQLPHDRAAADAALPLAAWLLLGVAGVVVLDRRPGSPVGWASVIAALTPTAVLLVGLVWRGGDAAEPEVVRVAQAWGPMTLLALALPALATAVPRERTRGERRWQVWIVASCAAATGAACVAWFVGSPAVYGITATAGVGVVAVTVGLSGVVAEPRPAVEPLVDGGLAIAGIAVAAAAGVVVLQVARREQIFGAVALSAFACAATAVLALPAMWWFRKEFLARRYGSGMLSAEEIATLTADLRTAHDPRELLVKAGAMVSATSGVADTVLVLDEVPVPPGWVGRPLVVGDELVGTMLLRPSHPGGLEARQDKVCRQLLPTIALVARAVTLAVEAKHARDDVAHQRDLERARMLADLHDDLGPVLAGMSMRVEAARGTHQLPELDALAGDLASCRADLRRIVSGLTPVALRAGDVADAVISLVESFASDAGPDIVLGSEVPDGIEPDTAVVVYRAIAEGITNAVKHADAEQVVVQVERSGDTLRVVVLDDGVGGTVVPGVGLQSLRDRAAALGGTLSFDSAEPTGTCLSLVVPERTA
jgi:signal transduction histidine kinase